MIAAYLPPVPTSVLLASIAVSAVVLVLWRQSGRVYWGSFAVVVGLQLVLSWLAAPGSGPYWVGLAGAYALPTSAAFAVRPLLGPAAPPSAASIAVPCAYLGTLIAILAGAARVDGLPW